jgi:hypothetical protein
LRFFRVGLDLLPQTAQRNLDGAAEPSVLYPQIAAKFIAGKHHPGVRDEMFQPIFALTTESVRHSGSR